MSDWMQETGGFSSVPRVLKGVAFLAMLLASACAQKETETWNSYYYGTSGSAYSQGVPDNDATYELPSGFGGSGDQDQAAQYYYQNQLKIQQQQLKQQQLKQNRR